MAGNEGISGQGKKQAAEAAGGAGAARGASEWLETKPFLSGGEEPPLMPRALGGGEKVTEGAARSLSHAAKAPSGRLGKLGALVAANGFLAGAAIVVSVLAFGVTGVALLNSTGKTIDDDEVATVGIGGGDKDPDGSTTTTVVGRPGSAGETSSKTTVPTETSVSTTTTRPTATTRPVVPPPTDPPVTEPPTTPPTEPPPAPSIVRFARSSGDYCRDQTRAVTFSWWSRNGDSASLTDPRNVVVASGLPADGSYAIPCVPSSGTTTGAARGTWTLTISGPGGSVTDTENVS